MNEGIYRFYGMLHRTAKSIVKRKNPFRAGRLRYAQLNFETGVDRSEACNSWLQFVERSRIPQGAEYAGSLYAGYIADSKEWCLPSWIWTGAAAIRMYCRLGEIRKAEMLGKFLVGQQQTCGGWIVRNDYDRCGAIPMLAPNDSAYIANNAFLSLYGATQDPAYLQIARRCADWIIRTSRPDGMVCNGYNMRDRKWDEHCVIVDVGFTGGLFAHLYEITGEPEYKAFLQRFVKRYVELFYIPGKNGFCTSINAHDCQQGGMFGRGQAWALEGLIPAYEVLKSEPLRQVIESAVANLVRVQHRNGSWAYNLTKPLMGEDCKAVPVIAKNLMKWQKFDPDETVRRSAERALEWCRSHTVREGEAEGGIFSYCLEGAIVQNLYTSCAFVYASAYAIELDRMLNHG